MRRRWHIPAAHSPGITSSLEQKKGFFPVFSPLPGRSWVGFAHPSLPAATSQPVLCSEVCLGSRKQHFKENNKNPALGLF